MKIAGFAISALVGLALWLIKGNHDKISLLQLKQAEASTEMRLAMDDQRRELEEKISRGTNDLENSLDSKTLAQISAIDRRFADITNETAKIPDIEKQLSSNTTDIEWLKRSSDGN